LSASVNTAKSHASALSDWTFMKNTTTRWRFNWNREILTPIVGRSGSRFRIPSTKIRYNNYTDSKYSLLDNYWWRIDIWFSIEQNRSRWLEKKGTTSWRRQS
jgi:hypothetical protein